MKENRPMILPSAAMLIASAALAASNLQVPAPNPQQAYVKRATWVETMLATRANCVAWAKTAKDGQLADTPIPAIWAKINADFRARVRRFRQDLPGVRYLDWFLHAYHAHFEDWIIRLIANCFGDSGNALIEQIVILQKAKAAPRRSPLARTLRSRPPLEDFHKALRGIWLGELRRRSKSRPADMLPRPRPATTPAGSLHPPGRRSPTPVLSLTSERRPNSGRPSTSCRSPAAASRTVRWAFDAAR